MVFLGLLLVGCGGSSAPVAYDPYARLNLAEQVARDADAAIQATSRAEQVLGEQTTYRTTQLAAEVYATAAALEHQATAVAIEQTQQAPALFLQATQVAIYEQATAAVLASTPAAATSVALVAAAKIHEAEVTKAEAMAYVIPASVTILSLLIGGALAWSIISLTEWRVERERLAAGHHDSVFGVLVMDYETGVWKLAAPSDKYRALPRPRKSEVTLSPGGVTAVSTPGEYSEQDELTEEVRQFLQAAADVNGKEAHVLPSNDKMGLETHRWTKSVNALKSIEVVKTRPGVGTYLTGNRTIGKVLYQLDTDELKLTPPSPRDVPWNR